MSYAIIQYIYVIISDQRWPSPITIVTNQPHCYRVSHFTHLRISSPFHCVRDCSLFFFFKTLSKGRWMSRCPYFETPIGWKIKLIARKNIKISKRFQTSLQSSGENFLFIRFGWKPQNFESKRILSKMIYIRHVINNRNWKKRTRKYRKEILVFPTLFLFLILSRYFFLFLYLRLSLLLPPSLPLSFIFSLFLSKDPPRLVSRVDESARRGKIDPRWCPILTPTLALSASPGMPL